MTSVDRLAIPRASRLGYAIVGALREPDVDAISAIRRARYFARSAMKPSNKPRPLPDIATARKLDAERKAARRLVAEMDDFHWRLAGRRKWVKTVDGHALLPPGARSTAPCGRRGDPPLRKLLACISHFFADHPELGQVAWSEGMGHGHIRSVTATGNPTRPTRGSL